MNATQRRVALMRTRGINLVLDVGANTGQFGGSLRSLGYRGRIVSFEPLNDAFATLEKTIAGDPNWTCHNFALGDTDTVATINIAANSQSSSFLPYTERALRVEPSIAFTGTQQTTMRRRDGILEAVARPADNLYLKIDAQGYEMKILEGASGVIDRFRLVQIETSFFQVYQGEVLIADMIKHMESLGFRIVGMEPGWEDAKTGELLQADVIFGRK